ncbi:Peroxidase, family 2-domain-containing protein [Lentinula raphanica]|nr:Peroxidase, family 2-domain-containing protein [Lentinula raphanica]
MLSLVNLMLVSFSYATQIVFNTNTVQADDVFANINWNHHRWIAPGKNDFRSPCPGLNTLANHGFISRDGRNITIPMVVKATDGKTKVAPGVIHGIGGLTTTFESDLQQPNAPDSFTLDDLKLHGTIEHDASFSRSDNALGDNLHFNSTVFNSTFLQSNLSPDVYDTTSVGQIMQERLALAKQANPHLVNTVKERQSQLLEASLFLSVMGINSSHLRFVHIFFREERLPLEEGWKRSPYSTNTASLAKLMEQLNKASQTKGPWLPSSLLTCPWTRLQPEGPEMVWPPNLFKL